jgi:hypothetical protein
LEPIDERTRWGSWFVIIAFLPLVALAVAALYAMRNDPKDLAPGGPIFALILYGWLAGLTGTTRKRLDSNGFRITHGPLPAGLTAERHSLEAVRSIFLRHQRVPLGKGAYEDRFFATVELDDGRWVNVRGPYLDEMKAIEALDEVAALWPSVPKSEPRPFTQPQPRESRKIVLFWLGLLVLWVAWVIVYLVVIEGGHI